MSRLETSFVLAYHGCERALAHDVIARRQPLLPSDRPYDWVGPGVYFWQSDPKRAWEWAEQRCHDGKIRQPGVVGAVIDLGECLDLLTRDGQELVRGAYDAMVEAYREAGEALPENTNSRRGGDTDRLLRKLDCAVIQFLHAAMDDDAHSGLEYEPTSRPSRYFDTVRGMFTEGDQIYPGAGFYSKSHVQIAVRNSQCIKGLFLPPELVDLMR